jgi:dihydrofolate reductase
MGRIVVTQFITLDGVVEDPGGAEQFALGGWSFSSLNDEYFNYKHAELFACGALLLGRVTYQALSSVWLGKSDVTGLSARMESLPKYVVTSTLHNLRWNNSTRVPSPFVPDIERLKQSVNKDILVIGSRRLVQLLMKHDLIDEYRLMLHPLVLGAGAKLFGDGDVRKLKLTGTRPFSTGVVVLTYVPDRSKVIQMNPYFPQTSSSSR